MPANADDPTPTGRHRSLARARAFDKISVGFTCAPQALPHLLSKSVFGMLTRTLIDACKALVILLVLPVFICRLMRTWEHYVNLQLAS